MSEVFAYLPMDRRHALARGASLPAVTQGSALFADISGFTVLADLLATRLGARRAGEELTRLLEVVYGPMIAAVHAHRGSVIGFAGDAITCWFDADDGARALSAARSMVDRIEALGCLVPDTPPIAIKVAVTSGEVRRGLVGDPSIQQLEVVLGAPIEALGLADGRIARGEIGATAAVVRAAGAEVLEIRGSDGFELALVGAFSPLAPDPWPEPPPIALEVARHWLHRPVYERLAQSPAGFLSELRSAASLFLGFSVGGSGDPIAGLDRFVRWVQRAVGHRGGSVVQLTTGDKGAYLYAAFGAPVAHESGVERAGLAALALRSPPPELGLVEPPRIGLGYGRMRTGAYGSPEQRTYGVLGDEANVAARLMGLAKPGQVLCSPAFAAVASDFRLTALGSVVLKGKGETALHALESHHKPQTADVGRLVGRAGELGALRSAIEALRSGDEPAALLLVGDAGIGKTSLLRALVGAAEGAGAGCLASAGDPMEQQTPLFAWRRVLEQLAGEGGLDGLRARIGPRADVLRPLLGLDDPEETQIAARADRRAEVIGAAVAAVADRCRQQPTLLALDDAHCLDESSLALLAQVRAVPGLVVVAAARTAEDAVVRALGEVRVLPVGRLGQEEVADLLRLRLGVVALPEALVSFVTEKAEGNPLFTEEIAAALVDAGTVRIGGGGCEIAQPLSGVGFPDTIEGIVTARIDRFPPNDQLTLKVASVIGRVFSMRGLRDVFPVPADLAALAERTARLQRAGLLSVDEEGDAFAFRSAVTREVAYGLMLLEQRRSLHEAVADALEQRSDDDPAICGMIAWHRVRALEGLDGLDERRQLAAVRALTRAGERSLRVGASTEAVAQLSQALELLGALPVGPDRDAAELPLRCAIGGGLLATRGPTDAEGVAALERARTLAVAAGDADQALEASFGLWYARMTASEPSALGLSEALLDLAEQTGAPRWRVAAAQAHGTTAVLAGRYAEGLAGLDRAVAIAERIGEVPGMLARLRDPLVTSQCYRAFALWFLGRHEASEAALLAARAHAGPESSHPLTRCAFLALAALLHRIREEPTEAAEAADAAIALATREQSPFWQMTAESTAAWAMLARGEPERALQALIASRDRHLASGAVPLTALPVQTDLVDAAARLGRWREAEAALAEARALAGSRLSFGWGAEVERQAARLALRCGDEAGARRAAEAALALARSTGAVALAERAARTLASIPEGAGPDEAGLTAWVRATLARRLPPGLSYHGPAHTLDDVAPAAMRLADALGICGEERTLLRAGALLHDVGFVERYRGHEDASVRIAREVLPGFGFSEPQVARVCELIEATRLPQSPRDLLGQILADADLDVLGREDFWEKNVALRRELREIGLADPTDEGWATEQARFLRTHAYFTGAARALRGPGKARNLERIERLGGR